MMLTILDLDDIEMSAGMRSVEFEQEYQRLFNLPLLQATKTQEFITMDSMWRDAMPENDKKKLARQPNWMAQQLNGGSYA